MRNAFTVAAMTSTFLAGIALAGPGSTPTSRADDQIDKKVVEIVKQTGELYKNAKSFHVDGKFVTKLAPTRRLISM